MWINIDLIRNRIYINIFFYLALNIITVFISWFQLLNHSPLKKEWSVLNFFNKPVLFSSFPHIYFDKCHSRAQFFRSCFCRLPYRQRRWRRATSKCPTTRMGLAPWMTIRHRSIHSTRSSPSTSRDVLPN